MHLGSFFRLWVWFLRFCQMASAHLKIILAMEGFSLLLGPKSARPAFSPTVSSSALPTETQAVQDPQADSNDTPYICDLFGDVPDDADYGDLFSE